MRSWRGKLEEARGARRWKPSSPMLPYLTTSKPWRSNLYRSLIIRLNTRLGKEWEREEKNPIKPTYNSGSLRPFHLRMCHLLFGALPLLQWQQWDLSHTCQQQSVETFGDLQDLRTRIRPRAPELREMPIQAFVLVAFCKLLFPLPTNRECVSNKAGCIDRMWISHTWLLAFYYYVH